MLQPLLELHAEREQVTTSLGLNFVDYSEGSDKRPELRKWFFLDQVNEAAARFPGILFHINSIIMTWLFFDSDRRLQGFFIRGA